MTTMRATGVSTWDKSKPVRRNVTVPFNEISECGAYYCQDTGWLYRVPEDGLALGHSPFMNIVCTNECVMTKISDDPYVPVNKAREICANWDFAVNFKFIEISVVKNLSPTFCWA